MEFPYSFASDNYAGVHPEMLKAIITANQGHATAYGDDLFTQSAHEKLQALFGDNIQSFFVFNGTAANTLALNHLCRSYQSVLTTNHGHIHVNECGAPENYSGFKLIPIHSDNGKLTPQSIAPYLQNQGNQHTNQVKVISLTQITELGTCYTQDELKAITTYAHANNCYVYLDGARLANAAAYLQLPISQWTSDIGIDMLSFGGTKNGMLLGEAVIILNPNLQVDFQYIRKQGMQLASKHRFIAAQFDAALTNNLWLDMAKHCNDMATLLAQELIQIEEIVLTQSVNGNMLFVQFPTEIIKQLQTHCFFYCMDNNTGLSRLVMSFDITEKHIHAFVKHLKQCLSV